MHAIARLAKVPRLEFLQNTTYENSALMRSDWPKLSTAFDTEPTRSMEPEQRSVQSQTASTILDLEICIDSILIFKACDPFPKKSLGFAALAFECLYLLRNGNSRNLTFRSTFFVGSPSHIAWRMSYLGLLNALMAACQRIFPCSGKGL